MRPITERDGNSVKLNLTIPMIVWSILWGVPALLLQSETMFWIMLAPWLVWVVFIVGVFVLGLTLMVVAYSAGKPIEWKKNDRVVKTFQRKKYRA